MAVLIFLGCAVSPPSLMDDVDAVQAQIARNMLQSGDWVTARLDGIAYLEKSPLKYWMMAVSMRVFGPHDWAARIPIALGAVLLCWVTAQFGGWAFGRRAGTYSGIVLATCVGLFLFTRILLPDAILTLGITVALWSLLRALDEEEAHPGRWAILMWAAMGTGLLLKGMIAAVFPAAAGLLYLALTRQLVRRETWRKLKPISGILVFLLIAAPWHVLAALRNPPVLDFTMHSERGSYHGFFWFYFINEQVLRFLNLRYPRDYNTVPRLWFWLFHLLWLFPWSVYFPALWKLRLPQAGPGVAGAAAGVVLGRIHPGVLHVFDHAGILFDALLSGAGAAGGIGDRERGWLAAIRDEGGGGGGDAGGGGDRGDSVDGAGDGRAGGYCGGTDATGRRMCTRCRWGTWRT